jgi:hypothetical protein
MKLGGSGDLRWDQFFKGDMAQFAVFTTALSPQDISRLYKSGLDNRRDLAWAGERGLVIGYHFDEGRGTTLADFSDHGNTGTLHGNVSWVSGATCKPIATPNEKFYALRVRLCQGNPPAGERSGSFRVLMEPTLLLRENRGCHFRVGGEFHVAGEIVPYGNRLDARVTRMKDGRVEVRFTLESTVASHSTKSGEAEIAAFLVSKVCGVVALKPGEVSKVHCRGAGKHQQWLELQIEEVFRTRAPANQDAREPKNNVPR